MYMGKCKGWKSHVAGVNVLEQKLGFHLQTKVLSPGACFRFSPIITTIK